MTKSKNCKNQIHLLTSTLQDQSLAMRKIEENMLQACKAQQDLKVRNTRVEIIDFPGVTKRVNVYLYSKCICKITNEELEVNHHGFLTVTTKSRINALLKEFNGTTEIVQLKGKWYWKKVHPDKSFSFAWTEIPPSPQAFKFKRLTHEHPATSIDD